MQQLAQHGYTEQEVLDALHGKLGSRTWTFRYELLDGDNALLGELDNVLAGEVAYNSLADIKRTGRFRLQDDGTINYLTDRIKPWARLALPRQEQTYQQTLDGIDNLTPGASGLMLRWACNETTGSTAVDSSGNGRNGTIGADVTVAQTPLLSTGSAYNISPASTGGQVTHAGATWLNGLDKLTVVVWAKANSIGTSRGILFGKTPDDTSTALKISYDTSGDVGSAANCIAVWVYTTAGLVQAYTAANTQTTDTMCIVVTWQSGVGITVYLNGQEATLSGEANQTVVGTTTGAGTLTLGRSNATATSGVWDGKLDDLSIFSGVVSAEQAEEIYLTGLQTGRFGDVNYAEWPQGVLLLTSPRRGADAAGVVIRDVEAYDQLQVLLDDKVSNRTAFASGSNYISNVTQTVTGAGIPISSLNITPSTKTLPVAMEWEPGTAKLRIVNDLLGAINYEGLFFDEHGKAIARPYQSPAERPSEHTYSSDDDSVILPGVEQELDLFSVANKWTLVVSDPDRATLTSTYTNVDPGSLTSTVNRGRTITDFRTEQDAADQATLDALVARLAFEASQVYEHVEFSTGIMPIHTHSDVLTLVYADLAVADQYSEHQWSLPLKAGAEMRHTVRRIVSVTEG